LFDLKNCTICPRDCGVNRAAGHVGYCSTPAGYSISSIVVHKGEEPAISGRNGICNLFFTGCNLRCIFCQNHQISGNLAKIKLWSEDQVITEIEKILEKGIHAVGFVTTSHVVPQIVSIIQRLRKSGINAVTVYNTNSYEKPEVIRALDGLIDVYLPDFKYINPELALQYSDAANYPVVAAAAIKEMYRQKGSYLQTNEHGEAESGLVIRHLVLPGHTQESIQLLNYIAEEISTGVHISLMSQYHPAHRAVHHHTLGRSLYPEEYRQVANEMLRLGFRNGWIQDEESVDFFNPDFYKEHPFE